MRRVGEQRHQPALVEGRRDDGQVVQVPGPEPGIVGDQMVAVLQRLGRELTQEMTDAFHHRIDVARRARHRLRQHPPLKVENSGRQIARFAHRRAEGGADHGLRLLFDDRDQPVPHHLALNVFQSAHTATLRRSK